MVFQRSPKAYSLALDRLMTVLRRSGGSSNYSGSCFLQAVTKWDLAFGELQQNYR